MWGWNGGKTVVRMTSYVPRQISIVLAGFEKNYFENNFNYFKANNSNIFYLIMFTHLFWDNRYLRILTVLFVLFST